MRPAQQLADKELKGKTKVSKNLNPVRPLLKIRNNTLRKI